MTFNDGMTPIAYWQAANFNATTGEFDGRDVSHEHTSLKEAAAYFRTLAHDLDRDIPSDDGGAWADLYPADVITGDDEPSHRLTFGPRGGIQIIRHY